MAERFIKNIREQSIMLHVISLGSLSGTYSFKKAVETSKEVSCLLSKRKLEVGMTGFETDRKVKEDNRSKEVRENPRKENGVGNSKEVIDKLKIMENFWKEKTGVTV